MWRVMAASGSPRDVLQDRIMSRVYDFPLKVHRAGGRYSVRAHPKAGQGLLSAHKDAPRERGGYKT